MGFDQFHPNPTREMSTFERPLPCSSGEWGLNEIIDKWVCTLLVYMGSLQEEVGVKRDKQIDRQTVMKPEPGLISPSSAAAVMYIALCVACPRLCLKDKPMGSLGEGGGLYCQFLEE